MQARATHPLRTLVQITVDLAAKPSPTGPALARLTRQCVSPTLRAYVEEHVESTTRLVGAWLDHALGATITPANLTRRRFALEILDKHLFIPTHGSPCLTSPHAAVAHGFYHLDPDALNFTPEAYSQAPVRPRAAAAAGILGGAFAHVAGALR